MDYREAQKILYRAMEILQNHDEDEIAEELDKVDDLLEERGWRL